MKIDKNDPPRIFQVGLHKITISDCGKIYLEPDEQVTFTTPSGKEHDFAAKSWGFYATPSVNGRLVDQGFKTALVKNPQDRYFIIVVDIEKISEFEDYLRAEESEVIDWLDQK